MEQTTPIINESESESAIAAQIEESENSSSSNLLDYKASRTPNTLDKKEVSPRPEYWPEDLWDSEAGKPKLDAAKEKLEKSEQAYKDLRKILSDKKAFEAYKKEEAESSGVKSIPDKYEFEKITEDFKGDRQSIEFFSNAAKEAGLNNTQANTIINKYFEQQEARDVAKRDNEIKKLGDDGQFVLQGINNFINTRVNNGTFSAEEADAFANLITDASSAMAISKIISLTGEMNIPSKMRMASTVKSREDIKQSMIEAMKNKDDRALVKLREELANL